MGSAFSNILGGGLLPPPLPSLNPVKTLQSDAKWVGGDVKQAVGGESLGQAAKGETSNFDQPIKQTLGG
jgi:hypothetical protein